MRRMTVRCRRGGWRDSALLAKAFGKKLGLGRDRYFEIRDYTHSLSEGRIGLDWIGLDGEGRQQDKHLVSGRCR